MMRDFKAKEIKDRVRWHAAWAAALTSALLILYFVVVTWTLRAFQVRPCYPEGFFFTCDTTVLLVIALYFGGGILLPLALQSRFLSRQSVVRPTATTLGALLVASAVTFAEIELTDQLLVLVASWFAVFIGATMLLARGARDIATH